MNRRYRYERAPQRYDQRYVDNLIDSLETQFDLLFGRKFYTTANYVETRTLDASTATTADVANVLCTLIEDLKAGRMPSDDDTS